MPLKVPLIKNNALVKKNKKRPVFLVFLAISFFFWCMTKLSKEYDAIISYPVTYKNLPYRKIFYEAPVKKMDFYVRATGYRLLKEKINSKKISIDLRYIHKKNKNNFYVLLKGKNKEIQLQMDASVKFRQIMQDTLFLALATKKFKKIPLISDYDLQYKSGYNLSKSLKMKPDSVLVSGPENQVDKIQFLKLETLVLRNISENIDVKVRIKTPKALDKISYSNKYISVSGKVEKFTEDSFEVPFKIEGLDSDLKITTYPKMVKVTYQVGLSNYSKITAKNFKVICNYNMSKLNNYSYLTPELVEKPEWVSNVKISPSTIEYLIQK